MVKVSSEKVSAEQVYSQLEEESDEVKPVDLHLSIVKPLDTKWLMEMYDHFKGNPQIIRNGFRKSGLLKIAMLCYEYVIY